MNHPQYKFFDTLKKEFFDTLKKEFPENQGDYYIDCLGDVYTFFCTGNNVPVEQLEENIIAVPFTGFYDKHNVPAYEHDKIEFFVDNDLFTGYERVSGDIIKLKNGEFIFRYSNQKYFTNELNDRFGEHLEDITHFEIIGSSLTNPELLEIK